MSHLLSYVMECSGREVVSILSPLYRPNDAALEELIETGSLWDGRLIETSVDFSVELSGEVAVLWLTTRYSQFMADPVVHTSVTAWEGYLANLVDTRIVRIDEFLLSQWEAERGDFWFREKGAFDAFMDWVRTKPPESWQLL